MAKSKKAGKAQGYDWKFSVVGGVTRVNIETGEDIAHLDELDQKLWTVLSCPVKGLELDERTLSLMDTDHDGRIRAHEVVVASQWLRNVLKNMDYLLEGHDSVSMSEVQDATDEGKTVIDSTKLIMDKLGLDKDTITLADVDQYIADYEEKCKAEYVAQNPEPFTPPYGDASDDAEAAVNALRAKVSDYFMRCKLLKFDDAAAEALDVQVEKIAAISDGNLVDNVEEIAAYPLMRPSTEPLLPFDGAAINPAWQADYAKLKTLVFDVDFPGKESINEADWQAVIAKIDAYTEWKAAGETAMNEAIAAQIEEHAAAIEPVNKLLHYCRDFFKLLKNYVVFKDFYNREPGTDAVFQAGRLYIDQRCCELCVRVSDMGKQAAMAPASGMYLIYCTCTSKVKEGKMDIVAALTCGDVDNLSEGKNGIFYDRDGNDWDATITKIIDNPISVRQAFWRPYRKFGKWVSDKINKSASDKESKQFDQMTAKADTASSDLSAKAADGTPLVDKKAQPFDIAKFAGIFAAIGLALGAIGAALAMVGTFIADKWYNIILLLAAVVLFISGPSMLLAWLKLRKRNIGPVLNANGWAVNSKVLVNTAFGSTLTSVAKFPKMVANDPFAEKKAPLWRRILCWLLVLALIAFGVLYFTKNLPWQKKAAAEAEAAAVEAVDTVVPAAEEPVPTDTLVVEEAPAE